MPDGGHSLSGSGAVLNAAIGSYHGKGGDEQALLRTQLDTLASGDILCALRERGVDAVFEQQGARQRGSAAPTSAEVSGWVSAIT